MTLQKRMPKLDVKMNPFKDNEDLCKLCIQKDKNLGVLVVSSAEGSLLH